MTKLVNIPQQEPLRVYVVGGGYEYIRMMYNLGYRGAKGLGDADIVLFTGGEDVDPALYGEKPLKKTNFNRLRDDKEQEIYKLALEAGIPMVGICRGGQFLNVMNGGKLWQNIDNHCVMSHLIMLTDQDGNVPNKEAETIEVTSTHHQMMRPHETGEVLAVAWETKNLEGDGSVVLKKNPTDTDDIEVVWYPDTNCLCFQPHPEFNSAPEECTKYFDRLLDNYIVPATIARPVKKEGTA